MPVESRYYPLNELPNEKLQKVIEVFETNYESIRSDKHGLVSNAVLKELRHLLEAKGYRVESGKAESEKIRFPLPGPNGNIEKYFDVDAYHKDEKTVLEVEAGRGVENYQFLKDIFEASVIQDMDYLVLGVRKVYKGRKHFETVTKFLRVLYAGSRLKLPLKGILVVGY